MSRLLGVLLLLFCLQPHWVNSQQQNSEQQQVKQNSPSLSVQEGGTSILNCDYNNNLFTYFAWYKKYPAKGPTFLISVSSVANKKEDGRFTAFHNVSAKHLSLHIEHSRPGDAALYLCAASEGGNTGNQKLYFGTGTSLTVIPNIENPDPAVYQLRSPESSNTSICLFTDFDSKTNVSQATGSSVFASNSTVLDMQSTHSKSYGALHWSDKADFGCQDTFSETFYPSSEFSCDVTSVEKSFETDMNLNFQNLSVIGFRILLLKVAGFNLLMTLRLWSS